jgi:hypothetical protein
VQHLHYLRGQAQAADAASGSDAAAIQHRGRHIKQCCGRNAGTAVSNPRSPA